MSGEGGFSHLRDDLLVEIAKRKTDQPDQILAIRGLQRGDLRRKAQELAACVRRGLNAPLERGERHAQREPPPQLNLLGQFLTPALTSICRQAEVAASMVGTITAQKTTYQVPARPGPSASSTAFARLSVSGLAVGAPGTRNSSSTRTAPRIGQLPAWAACVPAAAIIRTRSFHGSALPSS